MKRVSVISDNIISPLGETTKKNFIRVKTGLTGIKKVEVLALSPEPFYASVLDAFPNIGGREDYTRFERLCIASISTALEGTGLDVTDGNTLFILSTTKGNIELIERNVPSEEIRSEVALQSTAKRINKYFNNPNTPLVVSNACISGVLSVIIAQRLLSAGKYKYAIVTGADVLSKFVISGFQALHAMSSTPCKPFDKSRDGINLGEGAATLILSADENKTGSVWLNGAASTNDANHISGPSRTGAELSYAVSSAMQQSGLSANDIAFISAHGTATVFNDEMESKAFDAAGLSEVPLHSLKGNYGHTLGAAGLIESVLTICSLTEGVVLPSRNFTEMGVSGHVNVNAQVLKTDKKHALKTASGFGGCNAAIIYSQTN